MAKFPIPKFWLSIETCEVIYRAFKEKASRFNIGSPLPSFESRYKGNLESILYSVQLKSYLLKKDIVYVATNYFVSISKSQAFFDANKRMAVILTTVFLSRNGYRLTISNQRLKDISVLLSVSDKTSVQNAVEILIPIFKKHTQLKNT